MSNTVQIKRHSSNTNTSAPTSLADGELALNQADKKLYVGRHNKSSVEVFHLPTLEDITYGNGISGTIASGSNDNSSTLAVDVTPSSILISAAVAVTPSKIFISAVVAVTPSRMFNSAVVAVTPSKMFNSVADEEVAVILVTAASTTLPVCVDVKLAILSPS